MNSRLNKVKAKSKLLCKSENEPKMHSTLHWTEAAVVLGPEPTRTTCPTCRSQVVTAVRKEAGRFAYIVGAVIALFGCVCGCCLIPCCSEGCMDTHHSCPQCQAYLGRYQR